MGKIIASILPLIGIVMAIKKVIEMEMSEHKGNYNLGHTSDGFIVLGMLVLLIIGILALLYIWLPKKKS